MQIRMLNLASNFLNKMRGPQRKILDKLDSNLRTSVHQDAVRSGK